MMRPLPSVQPTFVLPKLYREEDVKEAEDSDSDSDSDEEESSVSERSKKRCRSSSIRRLHEEDDEKKEADESQSRVRFSDTVIERDCIHLNDYLEEEIENVWYSREDYVEIKQDFRSTLDRLSQIMSPLAPKSYSHREVLRGLEYRTEVGAQSRRANKVAGWTAVFQEQKRQSSFSLSPNQELIALRYQQVSKKCLLQAQLMGRRDAMSVARNLNKNTGYTLPSMSSTAAPAVAMRSAAMNHKKRTRSKISMMPPALSSSLPHLPSITSIISPTVATDRTTAATATSLTRAAKRCHLLVETQ